MLRGVIPDPSPEKAATASSGWRGPDIKPMTEPRKRTTRACNEAVPVLQCVCPDCVAHI